jgi:hypothetical protein
MIEKLKKGRVESSATATQAVAQAVSLKITQKLELVKDKSPQIGFDHLPILRGISGAAQVTHVT